MDVSHNNLQVADFDFVLRLLPTNPIDGQIDVDFSNNNIQDENTVALLLGVKANLKRVKLGAQSPTGLDLNAINSALTTRKSSVLVVK